MPVMMRPASVPSSARARHAGRPRVRRQARVVSGGRGRGAHDGLRQTTVCIARFKRRSNSEEWRQQQLPDEVREDRPVEIETAALAAAGRPRR